jgi:ArsR family transcriptional regulator
MEHEPYSQQADLFRALMNPSRIAILVALRDAEQCVCHLEAHLGYPQAYLSKQLAVLRTAVLVADRRDGWNVYYRVTRPEVFALLDAAQALIGESRAMASHGRQVPCPCPKCTSVGSASPT